MKVSELIKELETVKRNFGDTTVCIAQRQRNKKRSVHLTPTAEVYFELGTAFITNMTTDEIAETVDS